jgi:hypothetical protein
MYAIEQNIPIPKSNHGARPQYGFSRLEIGESMLIPYATEDEAFKARKAAQRCATYHAWKVITRKLPEGVRIWRVAPTQG